LHPRQGIIYDTTLTIRATSTCSCQCSIGLYGKYLAAAHRLASGENCGNSFLNMQRGEAATNFFAGSK
jgi:hypothetical protein